MSQTWLAMGVVAAAFAWLAWTLLPRRLRKKLTGGDRGGGGGSRGCH